MRKTNFIVDIFVSLSLHSKAKLIVLECFLHVLNVWRGGLDETLSHSGVSYYRLHFILFLIHQC